MQIFDKTEKDNDYNIGTLDILQYLILFTVSTTSTCIFMTHNITFIDHLSKVKYISLVSYRIVLFLRVLMRNLKIKKLYWNSIKK